MADWDHVLITTVETYFVCGLTICPELAAFAAVRDFRRLELDYLQPVWNGLGLKVSNGPLESSSSPMNLSLFWIG